jgi:hypothetical protein
MIATGLSFALITAYHCSCARFAVGAAAEASPRFCDVAVTAL